MGSRSSRPARRLSAKQLASIEQSVEKMRESFVHEDTMMEPMLESQVTHMEQKLKHLQENFGSFQTQQQHHNHQVAHEINSVKSQGKNQTSSIQQILTDKLEEQVSLIDAMLSERHRSAERLSRDHACMPSNIVWSASGCTQVASFSECRLLVRQKGKPTENGLLAAPYLLFVCHPNMSKPKHLKYPETIPPLNGK